MARKINVPEILEADDGEAALVALQYARNYAVHGHVIELMDLLAPEGARTYTVTKTDGTTKIVRN